MFLFSPFKNRGLPFFPSPQIFFVNLLLNKHDSLTFAFLTTFFLKPEIQQIYIKWRRKHMMCYPLVNLVPQI